MVYMFFNLQANNLKAFFPDWQIQGYQKIIVAACRDLACRKAWLAASRQTVTINIRSILSFIGLDLFDGLVVSLAF